MFRAGQKIRIILSGTMKFVCCGCWKMPFGSCLYKYKYKKNLAPTEEVISLSRGRGKYRVVLLLPRELDKKLFFKAWAFFLFFLKTYFSKDRAACSKLSRKDGELFLSIKIKMELLKLSLNLLYTRARSSEEVRAR